MSTELNVWEHNPSDFTAEEFTELISKLGDRQLMFFAVSQILGRFEGAIPQTLRDEVNRRINPPSEERKEA